MERSHIKSGVVIELSVAATTSLFTGICRVFQGVLGYLKTLSLLKLVEIVNCCVTEQIDIGLWNFMLCTFLSIVEHASVMLHPHTENCQLISQKTIGMPIIFNL
jgi:hypothetical protein